MIGLSKLIIFLFVLFLFSYILFINLKVLNKFVHKKTIPYFMIIGLGMILAASFLDMISDLIHSDFSSLILSLSTIGISIFTIFLTIWINNLVKTLYALSKNAYNDPMTGVYNRNGFEKVFKSKIAMKRPFYIMICDLDNTKTINDNFGHLKGDKYIISAAKIIKNKIGKNGFVGRTGGDEFIVFIENVSKDELENLISSIKNSVSNIFYRQNTKISIGYSKYKEDGITFKELIDLADERMYREKRSAHINEAAMLQSRTFTI